jgi:SAM-dependent methyltransferase
MTCGACASPVSQPWGRAIDIEYFTTDREFIYYRCGACAALTIDPMPIDQIQQIYPANYYSYSPSAESLVVKIKNLLDRRRYRKLLRRVEAGSINVLDVGGGYGLTLNLLKSADKRIASTTVVDFDANAKAIAEGYGHEFHLGGIESFAGGRTFELILLLNLIEHVADPLGVLLKVGGLLSDGGTIVLQTPNYRSLDASIFRQRSWGGFHCPRHWVLFDRASFDDLCRRASLRIVEFSYTQGAPFWAWSIMNELRKRGIVSYGKERPVAYHPLTGVLMAVFAAIDFARGRFWKTSQMIVVLQKAG